MGKRQELRQEMLKVLKNLDQRWIKAASREVSENLTSLIAGSIGEGRTRILAWIPCFNGEVDLIPFISEQVEHRMLYLPRVLPDKTMTFISLGDDWELSMERGEYSVRDTELETSGIRYDTALAAETIVLVPGLAFDKEGRRLARGQAYYDDFLSSPALRRAVKIGVGWSLQLLQRIPTGQRDVRMDWIVQERGYVKSI